MTQTRSSTPLLSSVSRAAPLSFGIAVLAILSACSIGNDPTEPPPTPGPVVGADRMVPRRVLGQIYADHGGTRIALPGASVFLQDTIGPVAGKTARSDADGRFEVPSHPAGTYRLCGKAAGFEPNCASEPIVMRADTQYLVGELILRPAGGALRGRVLLADGSPCYQSATAFDTSVSAEVTLTDAKGIKASGNNLGEFVLAGIPAPGTYTLSAQCQGADATKSVKLERAQLEGEEAVEITVANSPPVIRALYVQDANGKPIRTFSPGQTIQVVAEVNDPDPDSTLSFKWTDGTPGFASVNANKISWTLPNVAGRNFLNVEVADGKGGFALDQLTVGTSPVGVRFLGTLTDPSGTPMPNATMSVNGQPATIDAEGNYRASVPEGDRHVLTVKQPGYAPISRIFHDGAPGVKLTLNPTIRKRIDPSKPILINEQGVKLAIKPNQLVDEAGHRPQGPLNVDFYRYDASRGEFPGNAAAVAMDQSETTFVGMDAVSIEFTDNTGKRYDIAPGASAELSFAAPVTLKRETLPRALDLARYDEGKGVWAVRSPAAFTPGQRSYQGKIARLSVWSLGEAKAAGDTACVQVSVDPFTLDRPFNLRVTLSGSGGISEIRNYTITQTVNLIERLPAYAGMRLDVTSVDLPDRPIYTFEAISGRNQSPAIPPFPYSACNKDEHPGVGFVKLAAKLPAKAWLNKFGPPEWDRERSANEYYDSIGARPAKDTFAKWLKANKMSEPKKVYAGVWRSGTDPYYFWVSDWNSFTAKWEELTKQNLRLVDLKVHSEGGSTEFAGAWRAGSDAHYLWAGVDWNGFEAKWKELSQQNLRLTDLEIYSEGGVTKFAGVWREGSDAHFLWVGADWNGFTAKADELAKQNLRLTDLEVYQEGGATKFAGVWRAGTDAHYLWVGVGWNDFHAKWTELSAQNLRLVDLEIYTEGGIAKFAGVWRAGSDAHFLWVGADWDNFTAKADELAKSNYRLTSVEIYRDVPHDEVVFFNPNDLGLGRKLNCVRSPGRQACYVTKYGHVGGSPFEAFDDTIHGFNPGDTVAMEADRIDPSSPTPKTVTKFYIYRPDGKLSLTTVFDTSGPKYVPTPCLHCHGGGKFVVLDPHSYEFPGVSKNSPFSLDQQQEKFRKINETVAYSHVHTGVYWDFLNSLYPQGVHTAGAKAIPAPTPPAWREQAFLYDNVIKPSCRTCHMSQPDNFNFDNPKDVFVQWAGHYVCSGLMPNAMAPMLRLWKSTHPSLVQVLINSPNQTGLCLPGSVGKGSAPKLTVTSPIGPVSYGASNSIAHQATVTDAEDGQNCCQVVWHSDKDGRLGIGNDIRFSYKTPGPRFITAIATDKDGHTDVRSFQLDVRNDRPSPTIVEPLPGAPHDPPVAATVFQNAPVLIKGRASDANEIGLPCEKLTWTSTKAEDTSFPFAGCQKMVSFTTLGFHGITLSATDAQGLSDTMSQLIEVKAVPVNSAPVVTIVNPLSGQIFSPDFGLTIPLASTVNSEAGAVIYRWTAKVNPTGAEVDIGSTASLTWNALSTIPPFLCDTKNVVLKLYATNAHGTSSASSAIQLESTTCGGV